VTAGRGVTCGPSAEAAGVVAAGREGAVVVDGGDDGGDDGGLDGAGTCGGTVRFAIVCAGTTGTGFFGSDGASMKMSSDRPTNPIAIAAAL
jgi:hypothetical protein